MDTLMIHLGMSMEAFPIVEIENENMSLIPLYISCFGTKFSEFHVTFQPDQEWKFRHLV